MNLTNEQLRTLRHMLGINDPTKARPEPYRNRYAANPGDPEMLELERIGAVERYAANCQGYDWYRCTEAGRLAAIRSFRSIQISKSRRRYLRFLSARDAFPDLTFRDFLTDNYFISSRAEA